MSDANGAADTADTREGVDSPRLPQLPRLSAAQERGIVALLACPSLEEAARTARVAPATLRRWRQEPGFKTAYRQARLAVLEGATTLLQRSCLAAVGVLVEVMNDQEARAGDRVRAAALVLESAFRAAEIEDLSERLSALEEMEQPEGGEQ